MVDFIPAEKATPIRQPSTANLMIDSFDKDSGTPWNFQISRNNSILNGFFTRLATTEVVLEWKEPNGLNIPKLDMDISGTPYSYTAPANAFFTAADLYENLLADLSGNGHPNFEIIKKDGITYLQTNNNEDFTLASSDLCKWGFNEDDAALNVSAHPIIAPDLRPYRYIDFVSAQLTYNQALKDSSTNTLVRDVLCRWYFAWDNPPTYDALGFPILMGYTPFVERRLFNPPKQIRWSSQQPVGNLAFQIYDDKANLLEEDEYCSEWLMTVQVSEV
jgi:hypothetical protein